MRSLGKTLFVTLLILTSLTTAAASTADMTIFPKEATTPIDSYASYQVEIENTGPVKDHYSILTETSEVTAQPSSFYLDAGEKKTIYVWYDPKVTKDAGRYSFEVTAQSRATNKKYSITGIVNVVKEHEVAMTVDDSKSVCRGENANYRVEVTNQGIQPETFKITTDYGDLSQNKVTLEDGETKYVTLTASSKQAVTQSFNVVAASTTSYAQDIERLTFNSVTCYSSALSITPESQEVAAFNTAKYDVTVLNQGTKADTFTLQASQGTLSKTTVEVDGMKSKTVTLSVTPEELGEKTITVSSNGRSTAQTTATLNVFNGNDVKVTFDDASRNVCENEKVTYESKVTNTGAAKDTFDLSTNRGDLKTDSVELSPGESEIVEVVFNTSDYELGQHSFTLTAESTTFDQPTKSVTGSFQVFNCWDLSMNVVPEVKSAGENTSTVYEIKLNNTGTQQNTYRLTYEGPAWIDIKPESVTVPAGQSETAYIYASIPFQKKGQVEITATAVGEQVKKSETVKLVIGQEIKEAIKSDKGGDSLTGAFQKSASNLANSIQNSNSLVKLLVSIVISAGIVGFILYRG
ncbi:hypothetical protein GKQ38_05085 [Candidatus Nanohaloarchaea archaeon]|nr:hypothetical protein GKQ38_05085 [Candidatus Nanohaloarchaea archaeon]